MHITEPRNGYARIKGLDEETGYSWPPRILGSNSAGLHYISDDHGAAVWSELQEVDGHDGEPTTALYSAEDHRATEDTQCPFEILNLKDGREDLTIRYWMRLGPGGLDQPDTWRALFEWKSEGYGRGDGFRLIAFIYTDLEGNPYWHWQGDTNPEHPVWEIDNTDIPVPVDVWFLTEYSWRWSRGDEGVAIWKINGEVVGRHEGPTTAHGEPMNFIMLTQIYGDANPKEQWVDDVEIWSGLLD